MATYGEFLSVDVSGFDVLEKLQQNISSALSKGHDPGPELAFSVLDLVVEISQTNQQTSVIQARLADLEARILNAGIHLSDPEL